MRPLPNAKSAGRRALFQNLQDGHCREHTMNAVCRWDRALSSVLPRACKRLAISKKFCDTRSIAMVRVDSVDRCNGPAARSAGPAGLASVNVRSTLVWVRGMPVAMVKVAKERYAVLGAIVPNRVMVTRTPIKILLVPGTCVAHVPPRRY